MRLVKTHHSADSSRSERTRALRPPGVTDGERVTYISSQCASWLCCVVVGGALPTTDRHAWLSAFSFSTIWAHLALWERTQNPAETRHTKSRCNTDQRQEKVLTLNYLRHNTEKIHREGKKTWWGHRKKQKKGKGGTISEIELHKWRTIWRLSMEVPSEKPKLPVPCYNALVTIMSYFSSHFNVIKSSPHIWPLK